MVGYMKDYVGTPVGVGDRIASYIIDCIVVVGFSLLVAVIVYLISYGFDNAINENYNEAWFSEIRKNHPKVYISFYLSFFSLSILYFPVMWFSTSRTFGKMCIGAIIVDSKTGFRPKWWQWLLRYFSYLLLGLPYASGYIVFIVCSAFSKRKRSINDLIASTEVVKYEGEMHNIPFEGTR